jgi:hypothetical protein
LNGEHDANDKKQGLPAGSGELPKKEALMNHAGPRLKWHRLEGE